ncbi:hypothetical protein R5R35_006725 [Gryllus longicercus]|uniref:Choline/carnitine acyltransferase domain-containing protein n=1 Tax=Gryllus longicercus TaxID=2509291 RepID=A0AAN9VWG0_9ORTH
MQKQPGGGRGDGGGGGSPWAFVRAPGDASAEATFARDEALPSMPLPPLAATLRRWLDSVRPHALGDGGRQLQEDARGAARAFEAGDGARLHGRLEERARNQRNWVEKWWLQGAYLSLREPLIPFYSMCGALPLNDLGWTLGKGKGIYHAAQYLHCLVAFWVILRKELLLPSTSADKKTYFSMSQFRFLFNTNRVPQEHCDNLANFFKTEKEGDCPSHVIILSNGRIFRVNALAPDGAPISFSEWLKILTKIAAVTSEEKGPGIPILTCDKRAIWAKNRQHLIELSLQNKVNMLEIESSMFVAALDEDEPSTETETIFLSMNGNYRNRWADKSICPVFFNNGAVGGLCDHTAFDGAISVTTLYFVFLALMQGGPEHIVADSQMKALDPEELTFTLDSEMNSELEKAKAELVSKTSLVAVVHENFAEYGRDFVQSHRLHPDSFTQMALQLAYYRMHGKPAATYETATTRAFYNGRTETLRTCTMEVVDWVTAMLDTHRSAADKKALLKRAIQRHDQLMTEAKGNAGCDRHLFGLYCLAVEEGLPIPDFYSQPAYLKSGGGGNFILSTSLLGYTPIGGGVSPMCLNGYGCFYNLMNDRLCFTISVFKASRETSATRFYQNLHRSLMDMKNVLEQPISKM